MHVSTTLSGTGGCATAAAQAAGLAKPMQHERVTADLSKTWALSWVRPAATEEADGTGYVGRRPVLPFGMHFSLDNQCCQNVV
jgi:hypothetical protein